MQQPLLWFTLTLRFVPEAWLEGVPTSPERDSILIELSKVAQF
jgi:hypothetical protein